MTDRPEIGLEELQPISFLPVLVYYSIRRHAGLHDATPLQLIKLIETRMSPESDPSAWISDFLKINLHKLFAQYLGDVKNPDFARLDELLQNATDLLLLHAVADSRIEAFRRLLRAFCDSVRELPLPENASPFAPALLERQAQVIQKLLG